MAVESYTPVLGDPLQEPWRFKHEEMLSGHGITCMAEGEYNIYWFGCRGGLARYDGHKLNQVPFSAELLQTIKSTVEQPTPKALLMLQDGGLLTLLENSLVLYKNKKWDVIVEDVGPSIYHASLIKSPDHSIWLQTTEALWHIEANLQKSHCVIQTSLNTPLLAACVGPSGNVWVVSRMQKQQSELICIPVIAGDMESKSRWKRYPIPYKSLSGYAAVAVGKEHKLYYGDRASDTGVEAFDIKSEQWLTNEADKQWLGLNKLMCAADGAIWGGMEGEIYHISTSGNRTFYTRQQLQLPKVNYTLYKTTNNRLWILSHVNNIYSVDIGDSEWLTYKRLNYQCETSSGVQWFIANNFHIISHDPRTGKWLRYNNEDNIIKSPLKLMASSHGLIWAAGSHYKKAAISVFDGTKWKRYLHPEFAHVIEPKSLFEAADKTIWFGSAEPDQVKQTFTGGALQYEVLKNNEVRLRAHHTSKEYHYKVKSISQRNGGALWIGSDHLYTYANGSYSRYESLPPLGTPIIDLLTSHKDNLWLATETSGIFQMQNDRWTHHKLGKNLTGHKLVDLIELKDGSILAASDQGVSRFDHTSWSPVYPKDFSMTSPSSKVSQSRDGTIWLSFSRGEVPSALDVINKNAPFKTIRHWPETNPPDTKITSWLEQVSQPGNCYIEWAAQDFESSTPAEKIQYSWRLNKSAWSPFSSKKGETFLNLKHGKHFLEVRSRDLAFNIDPTPAGIRFTVEPPLWRQPWFIILLLLLLCAGVTMISMRFYYHDKRLKDRAQHFQEMDHIKTSFYMNLSHELMTPLTVIKGPLEDLDNLETNKEKRNLIAIAKRSADRISELMMQLLYFRKLEQGKLGLELVEGDFTQELRGAVDILKPLIERHELTCALDLENSVDGLVDKDKLTKIVTNLINNAIKYTSPGGLIKVFLKKVQDSSSKDFMVQITVEDNGVGIGPEHLEHIFDRFYRASDGSIIEGSGIGLNLTKELVNLWKGRISATSPIHATPDKPGTRFKVELPLRYKEF
ncbi:MAG: HAMP domain-containing sensor histidine kinase [Verrucomicrobiota bacterium]